MADAQCYLDKLSSKRHYLTIRAGQYWGYHVDLRCSRCNLTTTALKSRIISAPCGGRIKIR